MTLPDIEPTADEQAVARRVRADLRPGNRRELPPPLATEAESRAALGRLIVQLDRLQEDAQRRIDALEERVAALETAIGPRDLVADLARAIE